MYEVPVLSRIPGGWNARPVDLNHINGSKAFQDAILRSTTTFYLPEYGVFACTPEDKRKLVAWMQEPGHGYNQLTIFWPGKYQSHVFTVVRRCGAMTRIMELLGPSEEDKASADRMENLKQVRKLRVELANLSMQTAKLETTLRNEDPKPKPKSYQEYRDEDWYGNNFLPGQD